MKYFTFAIILFIFPQLVVAADITQCHFTFHGVNANNEINDQPYLNHTHVIAIENRIDQPTGQERIYVNFNKNGAEINEKYTQKNIGKYIAIFCNGKLLSKPRILDIIKNEVLFSIE